MSIRRSDIFAARRGPAEIRNRQFVWVRKGYDPDKVRDFLSQVAKMVEGLETELNRTRTELDRYSRQKGAAREEAYHELANRMADVLRMADSHAENIRREAEQEVNRLQVEARAQAEQTRKQSEQDAEKTRREAAAHADRIKREAAAEAERIRRENQEAMRKARSEAEHIVSVLASRRDVLLAEVNSTRERLAAILEKVNATVPPAAAVPSAPGVPAPVATTSAPAPTPGGEEPIRIPEVATVGQRTTGPDLQAPRRRREDPSSADLELVLPEAPALDEDLEK